MAQLSNTPQKHTNLRLEARKSYALGLWFTALDEGKNRHLVDLTGSTITFIVAELPHKGGAIVLTKTATLTDPTVGVAQVDFQASELDLEPGEYPYSATYLTADGYSIVFLKGVFDIQENTNLDDTNVYVLGTAQDIGHVLLTHDNSVTVELSKGLKGDDGADGNDGADGDSAYEVAVANGFVGTEAAWLASLVGDDGDVGLSAYEVAVANGFVGTEAEWLDSLVGADGELSGGAGGVLSGNYPNPGFAVDMAEQGELDAVATQITDHLNDTIDAHDASAISFTPASGIAATDAQAAIVEAKSDAEATAAAALAAHTGDAVDAHDASAISFAPASGIAATDAQAAIVEAKTDAEATAAAALAAHTGDAVDAHDASAISFTPASGIAATDAQAAIVEAKTDAEAGLALKQDLDEKGVAGGYASLDGGGKVPAAQLPAALMTYEGVWNANTNTPALADGGGDPGQVYRVTTAGDQDLGSGVISFAVGDYVIYSSTGVWEKSDTTDAVASVAGKVGIVTLDIADVDGLTADLATRALDADLDAHVAEATGAHDASAISFTPAGGIAATDVQLAIEEAKSDAVQALTDHSNDAVDAHDASAISYAGGTGMAATDVEAAIDELATEKADASALTDHLNDAVDAHDASAISYAGSTDLSATTVEGALDELDAEKISAAGTATLTNKRITKRVLNVADTATLNIDSDSYDGAKVTALAQAMTIAAPTGTTTAMQGLIIRIKDNGTARALSWDTAFRAIGVTLPTTTVISKTLYVGCIRNTDDTKWDVIAVAVQA